jgi:ribosomal protein L37E
MGQRKVTATVDSNQTMGFKLCPRCGRAVPVSSDERHCINDGEVLLTTCPICATAITHPYAKHCSSCGYEFALVSRKQND